MRTARHDARANALLAAGLVTTSGSVLWVTGPVNADGPSMALSVLAVALALRTLDRVEPRLWDAVWVGLAGGAAASIKATSVPAVLAAGVVLLLVRRRLLDAAIAAGVAFAVYVVTALPWGIERVWDQSYVYHNDARRLNTAPEAAWKVLTTLWERDALVVVALALALITFVVVRVTGARRAPSAPADSDAPPVVPLRVVVAVLAGWAVLVFALLVYEPALFRAHVAQIVPPLALLASVRPAPWAVLAVAAIVVAPFSVVENRTILWPEGYRGNEAAVVDRLKELRSGSLVISDDPGLAWRAGHAPPGELADPSFQRIENGQITTASLARRPVRRRLRCRRLLAPALREPAGAGVGAGAGRVPVGAVRRHRPVPARRPLPRRMTLAQRRPAPGAGRRAGRTSGAAARGRSRR